MPGRFEVLGYQPLVIVDGAHNPPGADSCAQVFFEDFHPEGRRILVVGTLREPTSMLEALRADEFDVVIACTAPSPRGVPCRPWPRPPSTSAATRCSPPTPSREACQIAMRMADGEDAILATGSLYAAGEARPALVDCPVTAHLADVCRAPAAVSDTSRARSDAPAALRR